MSHPLLDSFAPARSPFRLPVYPAAAQRAVFPAGSILDEVDRAARALGDSALHNRIRFVDVRRAAVHRFRFYGMLWLSRAGR